MTRNSLYLLFERSSYRYPSPANLNYAWNFGSYALFSLLVQILSGLLLSMYYVPNLDCAFLSVEYIMRDINYGWLLRYVHSNGASFFFLVVYFHMARSIYYSSYVHPREFLWFSGVLIFALMILIAFMGYVLPWGQMSFWAATVITNLPGSIPVFGSSIVIWLWGGFNVGGPTLGHFFGLHIGLSFLLVGVSLAHLSLLHQYGSNNPLGFDCRFDSVPLVPLYLVKDIFGLIYYVILFSIAVFFYPNVLGHPDNYIPANPLVTPSHIVPEWYFLVFYAILRCIPDKLFGFLALILALISLSLLPVFSSAYLIRSFQFRPVSQLFFWFFISSVIFLAWLGGQPIQYPYYSLSQVFSFFYFLFLLVLLPFFAKLEFDVSSMV